MSDKYKIFSCYKIAFPTEGAAKRKLAEIRNMNERSKLRHGYNKKEPIRVYECKICGGFHLTSKP